MSKKSTEQNITKAQTTAEKKLKSDVKKQVKKQVKKMPVAVLVLVILFFAAGAVGGFFTYGSLTKNDSFKIVGSATITLKVGETYTEQGAKAVSFGKDCSDKIHIEGTVDTTKSGAYNIIYTVDDFRFSGVKRVRTVIIEEVVSDGE